METYDNSILAQQKAALKTLRKREWAVLAVFFVFALLIAVNFKRVEVKGLSMEPAYYSGDTVIVWKNAPRDTLKPGDVIVFRSVDGDELIKRIVFITTLTAQVQFPPVGFPATVRTPSGGFIPPGVPDEISFQGYFNDVNRGNKPTPAPQDTIYVMGDNFLHSNDSRDFGPISQKQILGKVLP